MYEDDREFRDLMLERQALEFLLAHACETLLIYADADMLYLEQMVECYRLLGGGTRDAGLDGSRRPTPNQLAVIPGTTHYNLMLTATRSATDYAKAFLAP